ncbi:MAG: carbon storage regulator [Planctomycetaceae bacterium]|nr:carbon storage regulator [Planctomycetaceae bacterium]
MLVLSRREGELITIGDAITIKIVRIGGDKVRIGINAPGNQLILRGELEVRDKNQSDFVPEPSVMEAADRAFHVKPAA